MEYCEFLGKTSRLYEPRDETTRAEVMSAIYAELGAIYSGSAAAALQNAAAIAAAHAEFFWLNVVREATGG